MNIPLSGRRRLVSRRQCESVPRNALVLTALRRSAFAERFIGKVARRSETSISARNSLVTISERRSATEQDCAGPSRLSLLITQAVKRVFDCFFPPLSSIAKLKFLRTYCLSPRGIDGILRCGFLTVVLIQSSRHDRNRGFGRHFWRIFVFTERLTCDCACFGPRPFR